jgi:hypothetical protein
MVLAMPLGLAFIQIAIVDSWIIDFAATGVLISIQIGVRLFDRVKGYTIQSNGIIDDGEVELDGNPFMSTIEFSFQKRNLPLQFHVIRSLVTGAVMFACFNVLSKARMGHTTSFILFIFVWIAICIAWYPLIGKAPIEPNTYHIEDSFEIDEYSRIFLVAVGCLMYYYLLNEGVLIGIAILPVCWAMGIIPSLRIMTLTIAERLIVVCLGGSPCANIPLFVAQTCIRTVAAVGMLFFLIYTNQSLQFIGLSFIFGWIMSHRSFFELFVNQFQKFGSFPLYNATRIGSYEKIEKSLQFVISVAIVIPFLLGYKLSHMKNIADCLLWTILGTIHLISGLQQKLLPSAFPILINPFYTSNHSLYSQALCKLHYVLDLIIPIGVLLNISFHTVVIDTHTLADLVWNAVMLIRLYATIWVYPKSTLYSVTVASIIQRLYFSNPVWNSVQFPTKIFLIDLLLIFLKLMLLKTTFWVVSLYHFLFDRKERHKDWPILLPFILIISPISILISSLLDAPCMAYLGTPLLIISFPRPVRFWESRVSEYKSGKDTALYSSMAPSLLKALSKSIKSGILPQLNVNDCWLCRFEARILLIRIIESWNDGIIVEVAATELEPTSCHALEGVALDDILNDILSPKESMFVNKNVMNTLKPLGTVFARGYTESIQSTVGIVDSPQFMTIFANLLFKIIVYEFLINISIDETISFRDMPIQRTVLQGVQDLFPAKWFDIVKSKSDGYKKTIEGMRIEQIEMLDLQIINVTLSAFAIMLGTTLQSKVALHANLLNDLYCGNVSYTVQSDAKSWYLNNKNAQFRIHCIQSFRYAFKYLYDSSVLEEPIPEPDELYENLQALFKNWFCSVEPSSSISNDPTNPSTSLRNAFEMQCQGIFLLSQPKPNQPLKVRLLTYSKSCPVKIASINTESVKVFQIHLGNMGQPKL